MELFFTNSITSNYRQVWLPNYRITCITSMAYLYYKYGFPITQLPALPKSPKAFRAKFRQTTGIGVLNYLLGDLDPPKLGYHNGF